MKHINDISIKSYFVNRFGQLSTSYMFYLMQEIAWEHANELGFGYEQLKARNQFWVLSRLKVRINRRPCWTEGVKLETWSRGTDGFFGYRDYNFIDKTGKPIVQATSSWLILDSETKRIVRLSLFKEFPHYSESIFKVNASKLKSPVSKEPLNYTSVSFNEIDINQHFNSGKYIERIMNHYPFKFHEQHELTSFEINFLKEGYPLDRLGISLQTQNSHEHLVGVVREHDEAELVRAQLIWGNRNNKDEFTI